MGLSWQQGPLSSGPVGRLLVPGPLPERLLYAEPLRRRMRVLFDSKWLVDTEDVVLFHEPGHYPVAFFPTHEIDSTALIETGRVTSHKEFGSTKWFDVRGANEAVHRAAWSYPELPEYAQILAGRIAFSWRQMDAFFEEDERVLGHAADPYHRIDIRASSRHLVVTKDDHVIADTRSPLVLFESGFAPRWYVPSADVNMRLLAPSREQTFCPYKGLCSYWDLDGGEAAAAWAYRDPYIEVARVKDHLSFEPEVVDVFIDDVRQHTPPGQTVISHGLDRELDITEFRGRAADEREVPSS